MTFAGRGYHDQNVGAEDLSIAIKRWEWGRVHHGPFTNIYYLSEPHREKPQSLWIVCRQGRPEVVEENLLPSSWSKHRWSRFGIRHNAEIRLADRVAGDTAGRFTRRCVDDGPFYRRWLSDFSVYGGSSTPGNGFHLVQGISELLNTRNLHKPWFNWMIPYRLKRP
jgi:carotenoid 1,2-hydratase